MDTLSAITDWFTSFSPIALRTPANCISLATCWWWSHLVYFELHVKRPQSSQKKHNFINRRITRFHHVVGNLPLWDNGFIWQYHLKRRMKASQWSLLVNVKHEEKINRNNMNQLMLAYRGEGRAATSVPQEKKNAFCSYAILRQNWLHTTWHPLDHLQYLTVEIKIHIQW